MCVCGSGLGCAGCMSVPQQGPFRSFFLFSFIAGRCEILFLADGAGSPTAVKGREVDQLAVILDCFRVHLREVRGVTRRFDVTFIS